MPLLLNIYHALTPNSATITSIASTMVRLGVFGSLASIEEITMGFIRAEQLLFKRTTNANISFQSIYLVGRT